MKMELVVLDESFRSVAVIDSYKSLIWADRYNEYGDFELYLRMDNDRLKLSHGERAVAGINPGKAHHLGADDHRGRFAVNH